MGLFRLRGHYDGTEMNILKYNWNTTEDIYKSKSTIQYLHYAIYQILEVIPSRAEKGNSRICPLKP